MSGLPVSERNSCSNEANVCYVFSSSFPAKREDASSITPSQQEVFPHQAKVVLSYQIPYELANG